MELNGNGNPFTFPHRGERVFWVMRQLFVFGANPRLQKLSQAQVSTRNYVRNPEKS